VDISTVTPRAQVVDQRPKLLAYLGIKSDRRLVEQHEPRAVDQAPRDEQSPAHSPRELLHDRIRPRLEVRKLERSLNGRVALCAGHAIEARKHRQDLPYRQLHVEIVELRHDPHLQARLLGFAR
jgi:hypothetical protein